jgi:hypothetical protein
MNLKAKFTKTDTGNANYSYDKKELVYSRAAAVAKGGEIHTPVSVKCYMGRSNSASVVYCNVWIHAEAKAGYISLSGSGSAGGGGYHKISAAVDEALRSAGVQLYGSPYSNREKPNMKHTASISGVGDSAIEAALVAICRALGYRGKVKLV